MSWFRLLLLTLFVAAVGAPTLAQAEDAPPVEQRAKKAKKAKADPGSACCKDGKCSMSAGDCGCAPCKDKPPEAAPPATEAPPASHECPCGSACTCGKDPCTCGG